MTIHPTAVIGAKAELGKGVEVGPYCIVGDGVRLGDNTRLLSHVVIGPGTELGERNVVHAFATLGATPQDLKYAGEPTRLTIGSDNVIREYVNMSIGTRGGGGLTRLGDSNLLMAYTHVAHDCHIGSHNILANAATFAGHVEVGSFATIGAFSGVHQFCRVGDHAFVGGYSVVTKDALPYFRTVGNRAAVYGVNGVGLKRRGFTAESIERIHDAYRILFQSRLNTSQAVERLEEELGQHREIEVLLRFIRESRRGVIKR